MRKIMSANEAASRSEEVKAQYCDINAYNDFMEMLADEIKIAVNNGWTSTMPLRWGYLPDGYANKVITELSELGYKVNTVEDKMTVSCTTANCINTNPSQTISMIKRLPIK